MARTSRSRAVGAQSRPQGRGQLRYRVTNWHDYNESLRRRGDVTVWIDEGVARQWHARVAGKRGRPVIFSDFAIDTCLQLHVVFGLAVRQTQGILRSLFRLLKLDLVVPDFSTLSRRSGNLSRRKRPRPKTPSDEPVHLVVDSTGLTVFGAGEWQETKHGSKLKRRSWRKLHLGMDLETGEILCGELTSDEIGDPTALPDLLDQIASPVERFLADGAYDGEASRQQLARRFEGMEIIIPPPKTAVPGPEAETAPTARDLDVLAIQAHGRMAWQKNTGYNQRAQVETLMGRWKKVIGSRLKAQTIENQRAKVDIGITVLNKMTVLGRPAFERIS